MTGDPMRDGIGAGRSDSTAPVTPSPAPTPTGLEGTGSGQTSGKGRPLATRHLTVKQHDAMWRVIQSGAALLVQCEFMLMTALTAKQRVRLQRVIDRYNAAFDELTNATAEAIQPWEPYLSPGQRAEGVNVAPGLNVRGAGAETKAVEDNPNYGGTE
jgi:hypothetical protein